MASITPTTRLWEEYLEDHTHGLGKLLKTDVSHYTPTRLRVQTGLDPRNPDIRVHLNFNVAGQSGTIKVWNTFKADPSRDTTSRDLRAGGNRIYPGEFSLAELGYEPLTGALTIWLEAISVQSRHWDKAGVENNGKPDDRIVGTILSDGIAMGTDEVKYMVIAEDSFYDELQDRRSLRNAMASEGVYTLADLPQFALKKLSIEQIQELGLQPDIAEEFNGGSAIPGFEVELYQDYVSGQYVLTFAGTNDFYDVMVDIWNGLGNYTQQYLKAMEIASEIKQYIPVAALVTTGHSLGGGLASAASVVGKFESDTFNAAGLPRRALIGFDGEELYPGSLANYASAFTRINAYFLDWDILSFVQDNTDLVDAIGYRIEMDGPADKKVVLDTTKFLIVSAVVTAFSDGAAWPTVLASLGNAGVWMGFCHTTLFYHYGLLVLEDFLGVIEWDIYGEDFYSSY
jgi:hypothetical protein